MPPLPVLRYRLVTTHRDNLSIVGELLRKVAEEVDEELADVLGITGTPRLWQSIYIVEEINIMPVHFHCVQRVSFW